MPIKHIRADESIALFLYMIGHKVTFRNVEDCFQHSNETIHRQFCQALNVVYKLGNLIIKPVDPMHYDVPKYIKDDNRYWPYFIEAIDDTHIKIHVQANKQISFLNRQGYECKCHRYM